LFLQPSGSQTGVHGPFEVCENILWGSQSTSQKNQHNAPEETNFV